MLGIPEGALAVFVEPPGASGLASQALPFDPAARARQVQTLCGPSRLFGTVTTNLGERLNVVALGESGLPELDHRLEFELAPGAWERFVPPGRYTIRATPRSLLPPGSPPFEATVDVPPCDEARLDLVAPSDERILRVPLRLVSDPALAPSARCGVRLQAFDAASGAALSAPLLVESDDARTGVCGADDDELRLPIRLDAPGAIVRLRLLVGPVDSAVPTVPTQELFFRLDPFADAPSLCADHEKPWAPGECLCDRVCEEDATGARSLCDRSQPIPVGRRVVQDGLCRIGVVGPVAGAPRPLELIVTDEVGAPVPPHELELVEADGVLASAADDDCSAFPDPPQSPADRCGWGFTTVGGARFRAAPARATDDGALRLDVLPGTYRIRLRTSIASALASTPCVRLEADAADAPCRDRLFVPPPRPGLEPPRWRATLPPKRGLEGTIRSAARLGPVFGARVRAIRPGDDRALAEDFTSTGGRFTLSLEPTPVRLLIWPADRSSAMTWAGPFSPGVDEPLELPLAPPRRLAGRVLDDAGAPVERARIRLFRCSGDCPGEAPGTLEWLGEAVTDDGGRWDLVAAAVPTLAR